MDSVQLEYDTEKQEKRWHFPEDLPRGAIIKNFNDSFDTNLEERINAYLKEKEDTANLKLKKKVKTPEEELLFQYPNNTTDELLQVHPIDGENKYGTDGSGPINGDTICFIKNPYYKPQYI